MSTMPAPLRLPSPDTAATWSGGGTQLRPLGSGKFQKQPGLYVSADVDEELSCALDAAGVSRYECYHPGSGQIDLVHFLGTSFAVYPLILGVSTTKMAGLTENDQRLMAQGLVGAR